jgi:hypothetical protein
MKTLNFDAKLRQAIKDLSEKLVTDISEGKMTQVVAGDGCGGVCKVTCSWYCRPDIVTSEIEMDPPIG